MYSVRSISKRLKSTLLLLLFSGCIFLIAAADKESIYVRNEWDNALCEEWNIWLDSCENEREKEMMLAAFANLEKVMEKGSVTSEFEMSSFDSDVSQSMYSTPDFPDSGYRLIAGYVIGRGNGDIQTFDGVVLGIVVQEDGSYEVYNDHAKNIFAGMLQGSGVAFRMNAYTEENRANSLKEAWGPEGDLGDLRDCIFISYEEFDNIPTFLDTFQDVCRKMKEWQDTYEVTLNQTARIGELNSDWDTDFTYHASFYPQHELDFETLATDEEALLQLFDDIKEEQLAYFEQVEPERYEAILNGSYLSRADYRKRYIVPFGRHSTVYDEQYQSMGYRGGEWKGMSQNSERYSAFLEELIQNGGMAKKNINMEFPEYQFSSGEKEDIITEVFFGGVQHGVRWKAEYNDNYCIRYPAGFKYGSSDVCADMIFYEYDAEDKPYPEYTTDTERKENRAYDKGRLYLFAVPEILSDEMISGDSFLQYIQQGNLNERISGILTEPIDWKMQGNCQSIYHDFSYAEGETALRKIAIYVPRMRENENFQWVLLFEEFKDSILSDSLYHNKELIVDNFIIFPYWYECKPGDTLWGITNLYTNTWKFWNPENKFREICESPLNQIENPDLILPGQKIFIAPHLFLR